MRIIGGKLCPIGKKLWIELHLTRLRRLSFEHGYNPVDPEWYEVAPQERETANAFRIHCWGKESLNRYGCKTCGIIEVDLGDVLSGWQDEIELRGAVYKLQSVEDL